MSRPRSPHPKIVHDRARGQAACWYTDPNTGKRRGVRLGPWNSAEAEAAYARLLADLRAGAVESVPASGVSVAELCVRFARHARQYYGPRGSEFAHLKAVLAVLADRCGDLPASAFGPKEFRRVRDDFAGRGWQRQYVNDQARRVRTAFKWAVGEELVPASVWQALKAVPGLGRGRTSAPEREPVQPAPAWHVGRTLRHLPAAVAAMVRFQWFVGCRCQDVCNLKWEDIDRSGAVWVCRPKEHKGRWRGKVREFFAGPRAQRVVGGHETGHETGFVFRARHGGGYRVGSYCRAVLRACRRAGIPEWSPGQLRHSAATRFRERFGIETTRVLLGHASAATSEIYAERPRRLAADAARKAS
jgi:integrase